MSNAQAMLKPSYSRCLSNQSHSQNQRSEPSYSLPATAQHYVGDLDRLARRIAALGVDRLDELSLIGYQALDPTTRAVYEEALRLVVRGELES